MKRTQIYIDENTYDHLEKESSAKGVSISEIIRESIRERLTKRVQKILRATDEISGLWRDRKFDVDSYLRASRKDRKW